MEHLGQQDQLWVQVEDMAGSTTGTQTLALQFGGSPGANTTQEFSGETTALNLKTITDS